ncbi:unnamed protein product [Rotaria sordida]|uniref:Uncharacterized protein n=1 Tax=Rotaria sordida TaxID=392033 RepID=A0A819S8C0_9BILA|nr:unnamed protein product [Rotaria sordida]CAF4055257.1 unnamed protein product [Rotaria sordida]
MLMCYNCPLKHYDYLITPNNIPVFTNCTIDTTTEKFCSLNIYSDDNGKTSQLRASINIGHGRANISYILTGFDVPNSFDDTMAYGILYQCMTDNCNNPQTILKRILEATIIETYKPPQLSLAMDQPILTKTLLCSSYSNFTSIDECRPPFHIRQSPSAEEPCSTYCVTAINIDPVDLQTERICSYCEQEPKERFRYIDERIHLLDKRISYLQQIEYICNSSNYCNSLENIRQIQQRYKITFDFDIFFRSTVNQTILVTSAGIDAIMKINL